MKQISLRDKIELRCASSLSCSQKADVIMELFPKPRYPEKDGWPEIDQRCLFKCRNWEHFTTSVWDFDEDTDKDKIVWWIPIAEILELVGEK